MSRSVEVEEFWERLKSGDLREFAQTNPEGFKEYTRSVIEAQIQSLGDEERINRARQLQWVIDQHVAKHKTPLGACIEVSRMLSKKVWGEGGFQDALNGLINPKINKPAGPKASVTQLAPIKNKS